MISLMENELNKTPVKADFDYDSESPVSAFSDILEKSDSPSCVKWDFVVPAFSDTIKNAAMKLKSDVRKERLKHIRNLRRRCQDNSRFTPTKPKCKLTDRNGSDSASAVKQLQKTIEEILPICNEESLSKVSQHDVPSSSSHVIMNNKCDNENDSLNEINDDIFNDSVNDLFAECSQSVEDTFFNQPRKKLFNKEQHQNEDESKTHLCGNVDQLINEKDDDLFLEVDLQNLDHKF